MSYGKKGKSEGGQGGKLGHSNMSHRDPTEWVKESSKIQRRQNDKAETKTEDETPIQFEFVDKAEKQILIWAKNEKIALRQIEVVVPFIVTDKSLEVWFFFESDNDLEQYEENKTINKVQEAYLEALRKLEYPDDYLEHVNFWHDSHENVIKNYEGSYFYRMR